VLARVLISVAALLLLGYLFAQYARRNSMFFPSHDGDWGGAPEDVWFTASDGVRLHGWLFRAAQPDAPMIVWCHGNAGNITDRAPMAAEFARRGVSVFVFDWRGYGKSESAPSESGLYRDVLAAYDFAVAKLGAKSVVAYGESLGGPYAAFLAKERKVRAVVIENSFPSLTALGNALYRPVPLGWFVPFAMTTTRWLNEAGAPVLVIHCRRDQVIPFELGQRLYDELRVPKEMVVCETGGHCEMASVEPERYYQSVVRFVTR
jgi:uncharacterized protein